MSSVTASEPQISEASAASCDVFLRGRFKALQPRKGPRAAIDALFLAAAIPVAEGRKERVLEAGLGSGVASLALAARVQDAVVTGVEIQPGLCALARENAVLNGFADRIDVIEADLTDRPERLAELGLASHSFHHTAANPPYLDAANARLSPDAAIAMAYSAEKGTFERWVRFLARMTVSGGSVTIIHRADALGEMLISLAKRFGALTVFPLFPRHGSGASRVIVRGIKGSRAPMSVLQGMVLHEADGAFTPEADAVLNHGEALQFETGRMAG